MEMCDLLGKELKYAKELLLNHYGKPVQNSMRLQDMWVELWLPDVLERQELSLNLLSKLVLSLILEKHLVVLEYFPVPLKILE